ncbi:AAA family ATPase [Chloroflexota bacterium]
MADIDSQQNWFNWRDETITQRALLAKDFGPQTYLVQDLIITPGLVVLAGKKKSGKSWMTLQLAQCVASSKPFLGKETTQGKVVCLALEDGERRLKYRLERQTANPKLPIRYCPSWPPLNSEWGFKALVDILKEKTPALLVIDTLASAFDARVKENEAYSIGKIFNLLHELAIALNTVILIVAHHGKKSYGDVGFDIRGSSAIPGATDANIGLYKNSDGTFTLKAEGRDIVEVELRIQFDAETTWTWWCLGDDRDIRRVEAEARILEVIASLGECYATDIAKELGIAVATIYVHLKRMRTEGRVEYEKVKTASGVKMRYKISQGTGTTTPTRLPGRLVRDNRRSGDEGSRQVGEVGTESRVPKNPAVPTNEDVIFDEDVKELARQLRNEPKGDVSQFIASYFANMKH